MCVWEPYPFVLSDGHLVRGIKGPVSRDASPTPDFARWADMINNTMDESPPDHAHAKTKVTCPLSATNSPAETAIRLFTVTEVVVF